MSMKERMLAVVRGDMPDRVPFVQYTNLAAPNEEVWSVLGRENIGILEWVLPCRISHPHCTVQSEQFEQGGLCGVRTVITTPRGRMQEEKLLDPAYGSAHITKHFIRGPQDYALLIEFLQDAEIEPHPEGLQLVRERLGEDGLPHTSVGRTPFQRLWVEWVSIENLCLHMFDAPEVMEEVISLLGQNMRRVMEIAAEADVPYLVFADNVTAPIIGPEYFRRFCVPFYHELAEMLGDRPVFVHMDGDLKPLWKDIAGSGVGGLDSFSPPPDNDTSVTQAVSLWPEMRLWVNFPSSVHLLPPERIYSEAMKILEEGGSTGRLQIQISENVPEGVWRTSFPEIVRAISDFAERG